MSEKYLETIKSIDGDIQNLEYHQRRLQRVLSSFENAKVHNLVQLLHPPKKGLYRCRVLYDDTSINIEYILYKKRSVKTLKIIYNDEIEYSKKYANREAIDELFALRARCDDILIVKAGLVRETSIANIAFYNGTQWFTPKRVLLEGTTRQRYLKSGKLVEKDIFVDDLKGFTKVALMNAMIDFDIIAEENIGEVIC